MELPTTVMSTVFGSSTGFLRRCLFRILSAGPIPSHVAFILDGNRRYAKREKLKTGVGHRAGFSALISLLKYCYELGVKYVSVYAFSIDNFRRRPDEVKILMDLLVEKSEGLIRQETIVNEYGVRVCFIGNLKLLSKQAQIAIEKVTKATAHNTKCVLMVCLAYTSTDEIRSAVQESCKEKWNKIKSFNSDKKSNGRIGGVEDGKKIDSEVMYDVHESFNDEADKSHAMNEWPACNGVAKGVGEVENRNDVQGFLGEKCNGAQQLKADRTGNSVIPVEESEIKLVDIEEHIYMAIAPDPDIMVRTSGESRLSNFLLWQTSYCLLYSPDTLWPDIGLWELVWGVLNFQHNHSYLEKKKKQF